MGKTDHEFFSWIALVDGSILVCDKRKKVVKLSTSSSFPGTIFGVLRSNCFLPLARNIQGYRNTVVF